MIVWSYRGDAIMVDVLNITALSTSEKNTVDRFPRIRAAQRVGAFLDARLVLINGLKAFAAGTRSSVRAMSESLLLSAII